MNSPPAHEVTALLLGWRKGDKSALDKVVAIVYQELLRTARHYMRRERAEHTLQSAALVNETYLRLIEIRRIDWQSRAHFLAMAAQLMRRILVDHARKRSYAKRGGAQQMLTLSGAEQISGKETVKLVELDDALKTLAAMSEQQGKVVELRFFGGLTIEETAEVIGVSHATVERDWVVARAWLHRELSK